MHLAPLPVDADSEAFPVVHVIEERLLVHELEMSPQPRVGLRTERSARGIDKMLLFMNEPGDTSVTHAAPAAFHEVGVEVRLDSRKHRMLDDGTEVFVQAGPAVEVEQVSL